MDRQGQSSREMVVVPSSSRRRQQDEVTFSGRARIHSQEIRCGKVVEDQEKVAEGRTTSTYQFVFHRVVVDRSIDMEIIVINQKVMINGNYFSFHSFRFPGRRDATVLCSSPGFVAYIKVQCTWTGDFPWMAWWWRVGGNHRNQASTSESKALCLLK